MPAGRPKIELSEKDWEQAEKMAYIQCTGEEIANVLGICYDTLETRIRERGWSNFSDWYKKHADGGKMALRRNQMRMSEKNASMAIWLGKQMLGQRDRLETDNHHQGHIKLSYNLDDEPEE